ncbi:efflux RND transporter permease subunit [Lysinibacillus sp. BPa_S21]|uniref:efflux RND transporter permease subunit n=1 Tax=Lysinibacillus sp. BPa_S21 TaxID=2932478 RepID=UPI002013A191|nr:efflux RND transporter permease subunit [Lysinibacillus sp. BPa_S21]MCL1694241.1 efflux RND transporter permease subunit [Lysinibacillus sp. BPa_S21]
MKRFIQFSIKNALTMLLVVPLIIVGGIYSLQTLHIEKYPNIDIPYLTVVIPYQGASPEQAMNDIGEQMEREFMKLEGSKNVYTNGVANAVYSTIEFDMTTDMKEAEQLARRSVDKLQLPKFAGEPRYELTKPGGNPIVFSLGIYATDKIDEVQTFVKNTIIPQLTVIEGISDIEIDGTTEKYIYIRLLPQKLMAKGITLDDVRETILANNLSMPTGDISISDEVLPVRINSELKSIEEIKEIKVFSKEISAPNIASTNLGDIAEVSYESDYTNNLTRINGKQGISFSIIPEGGANTVAIVDQVKKVINNLAIPEDYKVEVLRDQSIEINQSVHSMLREVFLGAVMTIIITLLFLKNIRSTIIAVISIPVSIFASFLLLKALGYTLNIMTLAGIAVAVGRVVDDSIVVIENIFRRVRASKERNVELIEQATSEVASAITSSTITTVAVFLPLAFVPGIVGSFFKPLAWTIVISLLISLIVAVTIVPILSKVFLLKITPKESHENRLQIWYRNSLTWVLHHRFITLTVALLTLIGSICIIVPRLGTTFLPQEKVNDFKIEMTMAKGTSLKKTADVVSKVENILLDRRDINLINTNIDDQSERATIAFVVDDSVGNLTDYVNDMRVQLTTITEPEEMTVSSIGGIIEGAESRYTLVVNGADFEDIKKASKQMTTALKEVQGMDDVTTSLEGEVPEIVFDLDDQKLAEKGITPAIVTQSLRTLISGDVITTMRVEEETREVNLGLKIDEVTSLEDLGQLQISNAMGMPVFLHELGELKKVNHTTSITHLNGNEYVMVYGTITDEKVGDVTAQADKIIHHLQLPESISYYKEGVSASMDDGFKELSIAIAISVFLVYLVMVFTFKEGKAPFVILFAIPFSIIGALIGLYMMKEPIGMPAMIGLLMLNGIVVTNAIVLVDKVKQFERCGMTKQKALIEAGVIRIRPILMTAIATMGALIPMAISNETGMISKSLSVVVIGGLSTSTFLTLFIVPILYSLFKKNEKSI